MAITDARSIDPSTDPEELVTQASSRAGAKPWLVPRRGVLAVASLLLAGCTVGPKYVRPATDVPSDYKEASSEFKQAEPRDQIAKGKWWEIYDDPRLNSLEERISVSNQTLKAQQAQFVEARAALRIARAQLYPAVSASLSASRTGQSQNRALFSNPARQVYNDFTLPFDVSYEPDVWGRVRRSVEASHAQAQASAADLASVDLSLHAELATDYFELRGLDSEKQLLDSTVEAYQRALQLTQSRYQGGVASAVDVAQAQTQLETTRALAKDVEVNRARFEHAIAVLTGETPATFSIQPMSLTTPPPPTPPGVPSDLLERRPDIAGAERRVELASAQIGVARAAYFPLFTLTGVGGFESSALGTLIQGPSGLWAIGGSAAQFIFDGGQRRGVSEQARAAFDQSVASYRQTVLTGFLEVEDNLAALRILQDEAQTQAGAVAAAEHSLELSNNRYRGGVANYLEVTTAQSAALSDEVTAVNLLTRRMTSSVLLIKALGGGWSVSQIPPI